MRRGRTPLTEDYRVRDAVMARIVDFVVKATGGAGQWVDCFATVETARFPRWWTAAEKYWSAAGAEGCILWANPPYSCWKEFAELVLGETARLVCLVPDWGQGCILRCSTTAR